MPKTYNLFISHSWVYGDAYDKLNEILNAALYFNYRDYSVPQGNPIHTRGTDRELADAIQRKMIPCHIVIIMAGVYATYSKWINKEIRIAKNSFVISKPILGVRPWAQTRTSTTVSQAADGFANWNGSSIIGKIRELAI